MPVSDADATAFTALFQGSDICHYRTVLTGRVTDTGKHEARCVAQNGPITPAIIAAHLNGDPDRGIAQIPIDTRSLVRWGTIDIDVYRHLDLKEFTRKIHAERLPLVVCRSKSGGPHCFLFVKEPVAAGQMIEKLRSCAAALGHATSEVFPKQSSIDPASSEKGSCVNLPYYGGANNLRYGLNDEGDGIPSIGDFIAYAQSKMITVEQFNELSFEPVAETLPLPDGPPCLNRLLLQKPSTNRNILLANCAVYWRKADPEHWEEKLEETNRTWFAEPLASGEVEAIKKSYAKKEYRYQCKVQPLVSICNALACKKCRFGVGYNESIITPHSVTKINTSPPLWFLTVTTSTGKQVRLELTAEELQSQRLFQRKCMEVANDMPALVKQSEWEDIVREQIKNAEMLDVGVANTPVGLFCDLLNDFLYNRAKSENFDDVARGVPFKDADHYFFRARDLWDHLDRNRFVQLRQHHILSILKHQMNAMPEFRKIGGKGVNLLRLPLVLPDPEKLTVEPFKENF